ncbi:MAG TPA: phage holin family protein [Rubrobacter sp.]|nr:phage holin family protein [Rubrobacter sp.]
MQSRDGKDNRSLGELFSELAQETSTLVRQEVDLAKTEMSQKASRVGKDVGFLAAGGALAYAGLLAILAAVIVVLDTFLPLWLAALLVGLVVVTVGYFLVKKGLDALKREDVAPRQTIETLKEDGQWIKDQTR